jgi:hypothetical protein
MVDWLLIILTLSSLILIICGFLIHKQNYWNSKKFSFRGFFCIEQVWFSTLGAVLIVVTISLILPVLKEPLSPDYYIGGLLRGINKHPDLIKDKIPQQKEVLIRDIPMSETLTSGISHLTDILGLIFWLTYFLVMITGFLLAIIICLYLIGLFFYKNYNYYSQNKGRLFFTRRLFVRFYLSINKFLNKFLIAMKSKSILAMKLAGLNATICNNTLEKKFKKPTFNFGAGFSALIRREYYQLIKIAKTMSLKIKVTDTPEEISDIISKIIPEYQYELNELTKAYQEVRYSNNYIGKDKFTKFHLYFKTIKNVIRNKQNERK